MSLLFNTLCRLVITFLPSSKSLLISWLQSPSAVILEPPKIKSDTVSPSICHEVMGLDAMIFVWEKPPIGEHHSCGRSGGRGRPGTRLGRQTSGGRSAGYLVDQRHQELIAGGVAWQLRRTE